MPFIMAHTPESHRGRMSSYIGILFSLGFTIGPGVIGSIVEMSSIEVAWMIVGAVAMTSTVMMKFIEKIDNNRAENVKG